ncbi:unnamed protein product [Ectocarpus sp. 4 AP-2014]
MVYSDDMCAASDRRKWKMRLTHKNKNQHAAILSTPFQTPMQSSMCFVTCRGGLLSVCPRDTAVVTRGTQLYDHVVSLMEHSLRRRGHRFRANSHHHNAIPRWIDRFR